MINRMKFNLVVFFLALSLIATAQKKENYFQQKVDYDINVELNPESKEIVGNLKIIYTNNSNKNLDFIWFHLWPNAYKDKTTSLYQQLSKISDRNEKIEIEHESGFIDQLNWKINNIPARFEQDQKSIDIIKLLLPKPLLPNEAITITTPFRVKLPDYFSRSGYKNSQFIITQWYPKPAVYDNYGWHPMPYLDMGEFYSEFGYFNVNITVPANYVIGASGMLQNKEELENYKTIGILNNTIIKSAILANDSSDYEKLISKLRLYKPLGTKTKKTLNFKAENVHDFAWFADPEFIVQFDSVKLYTKKNVDLFSYYHKQSIGKWMMSNQYLKDAINHYSINVGEYPYGIASVVEGPLNSGSGGMEYPMVTMITQPDATAEGLDATITHEVGHNWFYGILASNERIHAWMDEGMNTFFQFRYEAKKYHSNSILPKTPEKLKLIPVADFEKIVYKTLTQMKANHEIDKPTDEFKLGYDYGSSVYLKAAMWMYKLEKEMGKDDFQKGIELYFNRWKFKHPYPDDFRDIMEEVEGKSLKKIFKLLNSKEPFVVDDF